MNRQEPNYAATLASIIIIFIVCHLPRTLKNIYEIVFTKQLANSGASCPGQINPAKCLAHFNNFILVINASSGFFIYCFVGSFGQKFMEVLTSCCKKRSSPEENVELVEIPLRQNGLGNSSVQILVFGKMSFLEVVLFFTEGFKKVVAFCYS